MRTQDAVDFYGNKAEVARALNIRRQAVVQWGELVPIARAFQLQVLSRGRLRAEPDDYPSATTSASA